MRNLTPGAEHQNPDELVTADSLSHGYAAFEASICPSDTFETDSKS